MCLKSLPSFHNYQNKIFLFGDIYIDVCCNNLPPELMDFWQKNIIRRTFPYYRHSYFSILKRSVRVVSAERRTRKAPSPARRSLGIKDQGSWMRCTRISLSYILANQPPSTPTIRPIFAPFSSPRIARDFYRIACPRLPNIRHHHLRVSIYISKHLSSTRHFGIFFWIILSRLLLFK